MAVDTLYIKLRIAVINESIEWHTDPNRIGHISGAFADKVRALQAEKMKLMEELVTVEVLGGNKSEI